MRRMLFLLTFGAALAISCTGPTEKEPQSEDDMSPTDTVLSQNPTDRLEIQGHRGCRGLVPENTVPGFVLAIREGADVLEMDLCISGDGAVIVSHEPWMNHEICTSPEGAPITVEKERSHNIHAMTTEEIQAYDCGTKQHPRFPTQNNLPAKKPTLAEVVKVAESVPMLNGQGRIRYNLEIKHQPDLVPSHCPDAVTFTRIVLEEIKRLGIADRTCLQSFSADVMESIKDLSPDMTTAWLVESKGSVEEQLGRLSFLPEIYSPNWSLIDADDVAFLHMKGVRVIPWTVNEPEDLQAVMNLGVDGIITDYPDRLYSLR